MIDTQSIRKKILDLALRGKLTEQLPEDGTAEELYRLIQQEKAVLIKAGLTKKNKPLPPVTIDKAPFEIPENWKWVRWGDLSEQIQYGYIASAQSTGQIKMVRISDIQGNKVIWKNVPYCDIDEESIDIYKLHQNDILFARTVFAGYLIRTSYSKRLSAKYIKYFMDSDLYWKQLQDGTTATAQPNCNGQTLSKMILPLPPAAEQMRIVEKLQCVFSMLDTIDTLQSQYKDNLATLKSKIIDAGIQGKLTEQLPEDGTAEELYQQIQQEKLALEKAGRIKKSKPLPPISDEEKPFDIPDNWKWVRLADVYEINPKVNADDNINAAFIPMERISAGFDRSFSYVVQKWSEASKNHTRFCDGDVAFAKISPCFENRKSFVVENLPNSLGGGTTELIILRQKLIDPLFTYYLILDERFIRLGLSTYKGTVGQQRIKNDVMFAYVFPLPPLAEQKRIVAKLEELLPLCEGK